MFPLCDSVDRKDSAHLLVKVITVHVRCKGRLRPVLALYNEMAMVTKASLVNTCRSIHHFDQDFDSYINKVTIHFGGSSWVQGR